MPYLNKHMKKLEIDTRLKEFNLRRKKITPADWKKHLESLPDLSGEMVTLNLKESKEPKESAEQS